VYPPSQIFVKLVNKKIKNAIKTPKRCTLPQKFLQPLYTLPPKIWQKPLEFQTVCIYASARYRLCATDYDGSKLKESFKILNKNISIKMI
jgi:hypothetical protein